MEASTTSRRSGSAPKIKWAAGAAAVIVLSGAGTAVAINRSGSGGGAKHVVTEVPAPKAAGQPVVLPGKDTAPGLTAASPRAAVQKFLDAEISGDYSTSLGMLVDSERAQAGAPAVWRAAHGSLPHYLSYQFNAADGVTTTVHYEPHLDETTGYTPATATVTWATQPEGGGYRVSLTSSAVAPVLPPDAEAGATALEWTAARQRCEVKAQYVGNLLGTPAVATGLCKTAGTFTAGQPGPLSGFVDPTVVTSAFGPGADRFTRVVPLSGPSQLQVVVAPLGDSWVVVGVAKK